MEDKRGWLKTSDFESREDFYFAAWQRDAKEVERLREDRDHNIQRALEIAKERDAALEEVEKLTQRIKELEGR